METIVIGVDHGWSSIKTTNFIFPSGVGEITTEPAFINNILEYEGKWYQVGTGRQPVMPNKVSDNRYYLLTLAAIAKELKFRKKRKASVYLSAGLPLTRFGAEKDEFLAYLGKNKELDFKFEGENYHVDLVKVSVYPQCYAAVAAKMDTMEDDVLVVDIGSWTIDVMPIRDKLPIENQCLTLPRGIITCMNHINGECVRQFNTELGERTMEEFMRTGTANVGKQYLDLMKNEVREFANTLWNTLSENGYRIGTTPIVFVGGGAALIKNYGPKERNLTFVQDVRANARGFEYLGQLWLLSHPM